MTVQTTYSTTHGAAYAGMIATNALYNASSKRVDVVDGVGFGLGVLRSAPPNADDGLILPTPAFDPASDFLGFVVRTLDEVTQQDGTFEKAQYSSASVMNTGEIWVPCPTGCAAGDAVYIRTDAGFEGVADDGTTGAAVELLRSRFENTVAAGADALALVSIGLGNAA